MALHEDWLLDQIARFAKALADVMAARDEGDEEAAQELIESGLRTLVGLSSDVLCRMAPAAIRPLVSRPEGLEVDRAIAVALYLVESAGLSEPVGAHHRRATAVGLLALVAAETEASPEVFGRLDELARRVHLSALPAETLERLLSVFEARGRYDRAEDVVFAWLERDVEAAFGAGMALFERLWGMPEPALKAGGFSSAEVMEGMTELQQRAGRK